ncbi:hypothetical protein [Bifidobacterium sp. SO1]|uniref:hypothetical protein n=1 Tax=Bifidobacterium sp. SO1 TaxID=2809029 RepID=UPI001BDDA4A2|nr:hypothetical protein [Bifidobacterium sp. SO1]MBT1161795.1 hypothetical protein [Bifidobacterium sp. SO1]
MMFRFPFMRYHRNIRRAIVSDAPSANLGDEVVFRMLHYSHGDKWEGARILLTQLYHSLENMDFADERDRRMLHEWEKGISLMLDKSERTGIMNPQRLLRMVKDDTEPRIRS